MVNRATSAGAPQSKKASSGGVFSVSGGATVLMTLYIAFSMFNIYRLMFPLSMLDLSKYDYPRDFVHPLWNRKLDESSALHMRVYLSPASKFTVQFLEAQDFGTESEETDETPRASLPPHVLLWDQKLDVPALSKSFLLTNLEEQSDACETDASYQYAVDWLNRTERMFQAEHDGKVGFLSTLSAASGHGIESTSFLLTLYESLARRLRSLLEYLSVIDKRSTSEDGSNSDYGFVGRTTVTISPTSPIWSALQSNSTIFVHVLVLRTGTDSGVQQWPPTSIQDAEKAIRQASSTNSLLMGQVSMIKYDTPNHVGMPRRVLYRDLVYFWNKFVKGSREMPPWVMAIYKPDEYAAYHKVSELKQRGGKYPYWKPEVSIKYVCDENSYPASYAHMSGMPLVQVRGRSSGQHPTGYAFTPALHVDEMGMTSEKYIPVNETVTSLPLRISFDRSDMEHKTAMTTATAGGISPARWRLLTHLSGAIEKQKELGFDESDIDDLKRLIADTNITLLAITMLASALHLLFEFLTFKSEVSFWNNNKDLTGLSVRSLFLDLIGQTIILCYLIEQESSLLTTVPCGIGCLIALWKCRRAAGLQFVKASGLSDRPVAWWNWLPRRLTGYELRATRLDERALRNDSDESNKSVHVKAKDRLIAMTIESDRLATRYLGAFLLPLAGGYTLHSLIYEEHRSWYAWLITSAASAVYALGFVLMTPQLFLNWKMKSVAHLPWRVLVYKSLNTFIDDLFSFIIRMPTMARISCFRDDVVFFIYLYQRWLYPVDTSRPVEGGGDGEPLSESQVASVGETKKDQ